MISRKERRSREIANSLGRQGEAPYYGDAAPWTCPACGTVDAEKDNPDDLLCSGCEREGVTWP